MTAAAARRRSPLTTIPELAAELASGGESADRPVLLDVRWDLARGPRPDLYARAHIPGAAFVDLDATLASPAGDRSRGRHPLPDPSDLIAALRAVGVHRDRAVVAYDDAGGMTAARAWWLLRDLGHESVSVLDGGLAEWRAAGHATEQGDPGPPTQGPGDLDGRPGHMARVDAAAAAALPSAGGILLDARAGERYRGETEPMDPAAGHIPGALSRPTTENLTPDGRLRTAGELAVDFAALGARADGPPVAVYCGSGVTAAHQVLALELAGITAALYPGSWSEWSADPSRPVATGPRP